MKPLVFAVVLFLMVPALHAQQSETRSATEDQPQAASQAPPDWQSAVEYQNAQGDLPASIRPGHPLDPADVDVLTGKRDGKWRRRGRRRCLQRPALAWDTATTVTLT